MTKFLTAILLTISCFVGPSFAGIMKAKDVGMMSCNNASTSLSNQTALASADTSPIIPRHALFGNPEKINVQLSPYGKYISYLAPKDGVLNLWIAARDDL